MRGRMGGVLGEQCLYGFVRAVVVPASAGRLIDRRRSPSTAETEFTLAEVLRLDRGGLPVAMVKESKGCAVNRGLKFADR